MSSTYGVSTSGFTPMRLADCKADLDAGIAGAFGGNVNLGDSTVFGQLSGVLAERFALLWEALADTYASQYPGTAEGISIDNILSLNGLTRLPARATVTATAPNVQSNGLVDYGLVLYGTPGTLIPQGSIVQTTTQPVLNFTLNSDVTIGVAVNAQQQLQFSQVPTQGSYSLNFTTPSGAVVATRSIAYAAEAQATQVTFASAPTTGSYVLTFSGAVTGSTASLAFNATVAQVKSAIAAITPFASVNVTGTAQNYRIAWPTAAMPIVSVASSGLDVQPSVTQAGQASINAIVDPNTQSLPFTDVSFFALSQTACTLAFGANTPVTGQPSSGKSQQANVAVATNSLQAGTAVCNIAIVSSQAGTAAKGLGSATCTQTGPNQVPANVLSVIGSGRSGWTGVNNDLDCITGANLETDEEALARRSTLLASRGSGALPAVQQNVAALDDVTACIAFDNQTNASLQTIVFGQAPTTGSYQLTYQGTPTATLPYTAAAGDVQQALAALPGLGMVRVTGSAGFGFFVDFAGSYGGQAQPLLGVANNTTGQTLTAYFARPPKSVELVVQGGSDQDVAQAIFNNLPAGMASYGQPILRTTGTSVAGSTNVILASVVGVAAGQGLSGQGLAVGSIITGITGNTVTVSAPALGSYTQVPMVVQTTVAIQDTSGNTHLINFSRPTTVVLYVTVNLLTDYYQTPGQPSSGINPSAKFNPAVIPQIQSNLLSIVKQVPIGGTVVARGSNGLIGAFNQVGAGILDYTLLFDTLSPPKNSANIVLPSEGLVSLQSFNINIAFS